jgi:hypothetical protein
MRSLPLSAGLVVSSAAKPCPSDFLTSLCTVSTDLPSLAVTSLCLSP